MKLFKQEVENSLILVEYLYSTDEDLYKITHKELLSLIENVCLGVIYKADLRNEIYKENN